MLERARRSAVRREGDLTLRSGVVVPGPCWDVGKHASVDAGFLDLEDLPDSDRDLRLDLDGDGTPDIGKNGGGRINFLTYRFYVMRGDCGYFVGAIELAGVLRATRDTAKGLVQLEGSWGCGDAAGAGPQHARWSFDGMRYVRSKRWTDHGQARCNDPEDY